MNGNLFFSAVFRFRNFATIIFWITAVTMLSGALPEIRESLTLQMQDSTLLASAYGLGTAFYVGLVVQSLFSNSFREEVKRKEKRREINGLNLQCRKLAMQTKNLANPIQRQKLKKLMKDKDEIFDSYRRSEEWSYLKEKIVEKSLNLVISYTKLMTNYTIRNKEISQINISDLLNKINVNRRKINFMTDERMREDINSLIEMDENAIQRVKEERVELDRIHARLDYIEGMINMFKHQIVSSIESEEMLEKLDTAVNEATALDNVLQERRRNQLRM